MLIVRNILCLDGGKILVIKTQQLLEVMDKLFSNLNDLFILYLMLSLYSLGFWDGFVCVCDLWDIFLM